METVNKIKPKLKIIAKTIGEQPGDMSFDQAFDNCKRKVYIAMDLNIGKMPPIYTVSIESNVIEIDKFDGII